MNMKRISDSPTQRTDNAELYRALGFDTELRPEDKHLHYINITRQND